MYKKGNRIYSIVLVFMLAAATLMILFAGNTGTAKVKADLYAADAMWIEPSVLDFNAYEVNVGYRFNVTIWLNVTSDNMFSWQFKLYYNTSQIQATNAGYSNGSYSEWALHRTGGGTGAVTPVIAEDYVLFTESCTGDNYVPAGTCARLAWVEFEIVAAPPISGSFESLLDINNTNTWVMNLDLEEIPITKYSAEYHYSYTDTIPPTIDTPIQEPADNVQPGQEVKISVNVTDAESGVKNVTLYYTNNTEWYPVQMLFNETSGYWEATIPGHDADTTVKYKIEAYDNAGNCAVNDNAGEYYIYTVVPEFSSVIFVLIALMAASIVAIKLRKKSNK